MKRTLVSLVVLVVAALAAHVQRPGSAAAPAQTKTPPSKLTFPAKNGAVTFDHAAHAKRANNDCAVCRPALFAENAKAPLKFRPPHKAAEDKQLSCGFCHAPGAQPSPAPVIARNAT